MLIVWKILAADIPLRYGSAGIFQAAHWMRAWLAMLLLLVAAGAHADALRSIQLLNDGSGVRAVFDLDSAPRAKVFSLSGPERVVIDLDGVVVPAAVRSRSYGTGVVTGVRFGRRGDGARVVLDLSRAVKVHESTLPVTERYGHRLVVDLGTSSALAIAVPAPAGAPARADTARTAHVAPSPPARSVQAAATEKLAVTSVAPARAAPSAVLRAKPIVVAVDAGHGGKDSGARGPGGLEEKTVTLGVARRLAALINAQPGMKAVLTRTGDYYVDLRQRMTVARKANADIFVSIHANAARDASVRGTSVYMLSQHGATNEQARWVADRENAADMVGGIDISDKSSQLASVLVDISQSATMDASFDLASRLLREMAKISPVLHNDPRVQRAAFVVLKAPDIPSVLVETDFITNRQEERLLGSGAYQEKIARQLMAGIDGYFAHYRPKERTPLQTASQAGLQEVGYTAAGRAPAEVTAR
ncbi:MAG TPA: N-acetylmuramoyl-L-alanine amidase [Nevskiaceae bacterium]